MLEYGVIKKIDGNIATVCFKRHGECDRCLLCHATNDGANCELKVVNSLDASEGDYVKVAVYKRSTRTLSVVLYILPLLLTAIGVTVGSFMSLVATLIIGVACLVCGLGIAIPLDVRVVRRMKGFAPEMTSLCSEAEYDANK